MTWKEFKSESFKGVQFNLKKLCYCSSLPLIAWIFFSQLYDCEIPYIIVTKVK